MQSSPFLVLACPARVQLLLKFDLARFARLNFRHSTIALYRAGRTNALVSVCCFGFAKLRSVLTPNQDREYFVWVWLVEVQERRLPLAPVRVACAHNLAADRRPFADVILGFGSSELLCLAIDREIREETQSQVATRTSTFSSAPLLF